jgi:pyridinium-3,5-biscarboxylic acid mononucleotide synthase
MESISDILFAVKEGKVSVKKAEGLLKLNALALVGDYANLDYNRYLRRGVPEIVYARNKTVPQLLAIVERLCVMRLKKGNRFDSPILLSRVNEVQSEAIIDAFSKSSVLKSKLKIRSFPEAGIVAVVSKTKKRISASERKVALLAAGTSDIHALNESEIVLNLLGCRTIRFNDVGVAGLHRLVEPMRRVHEFDPDAIIVAAGMEGALPSVVAGLSSVPVIGLPTSVGYGYGKDGEAALMSMLQACALGISVVNIDSGVAAGIVAWLISSRARALARRDYSVS